MTREEFELGTIIHNAACQCRGHATGLTLRSRDVNAMADAVLSAGFRRVAEDPETVERVAKAMWSGPPEWDDSVVQNLEQYGKTWRAMAAAALAALRGGEQQ